MKTIELILFILTLLFYSASAFVNLLYPDFIKILRRDWFLFFGWMFHAWTVLVRWDSVGHPPFMGTYESTLAGSLILISSGILFRQFFSKSSLYLIFVTLFTAILLIYSLFFFIGYLPLTISEQGLIVELHILSAWVAFAFYSLSFVSSLLMFMKRENITSIALQDEFSFYLLCSGFAFLTLMMSLGSYYSFVLFGRWWRWDPIETIALISWLTSGLVIHTKLFYKWEGRRFAVLVMISFLFIIILYKVFPFVPRALTYHNFDLRF